MYVKGFRYLSDEDLRNNLLLHRSHGSALGKDLALDEMEKRRGDRGWILPYRGK